MKKFALLALLMSPLFSAGCGMISVSASNLPFLTGSGTSVSIMNASDYTVRLTLNTRPMHWKDADGKKVTELPRGLRAPISAYNWGQYDGCMVLSVDAFQDKEYVGSAAYTLSVPTNYSRPYSLSVVNDDRRGIRIINEGGWGW